MNERGAYVSPRAREAAVLLIGSLALCAALLGILWLAGIVEHAEFEDQQPAIESNEEEVHRELRNW